MTACQELVTYLEQKRGIITCQLLRVVRSNAQMKHAGRLTTGQLISNLPSLFGEVRRRLRQKGGTVGSERLFAGARKYGHNRCAFGYQLDEIFVELIASNGACGKRRASSTRRSLL